ncbi:MAG: hypothetical protein IIC12_03615 [Proteobacteria bacterium]|nr:hypothetical protein [Pseudomonadota bacterium]
MGGRQAGFRSTVTIGVDNTFAPVNTTDGCLHNDIFGGDGKREYQQKKCNPPHEIQPLILLSVDDKPLWGSFH